MYYRIPEHAVSRHDGRNEDARAGRFEGGRVDECGYDDKQCGRRASNYCSNGGNGDYLRHYSLIFHDSGVANRIDRLECREHNVHVAFHSSQITVQISSYKLSTTTTTHARTSLTTRRTFPPFEHRHAVSHRRRNGSF